MLPKPILLNLIFSIYGCAGGDRAAKMETEQVVEAFRLEMAAKQQHIRARATKIISIINETRTAPEKVDRKAREVTTIRVDMVATVEAPLLQTRELVVGEWAVETVGMAAT